MMILRRGYMPRVGYGAINGQLPGPPFHTLSCQRPAIGVGSPRTYRVIAEVPFGTEHIPEHAWKTTIRAIEPPSRAKRLCSDARGYRDLLRAQRETGRSRRCRLGCRKRTPLKSTPPIACRLRHHDP
jgi:hypothetical protein